MSTNEMMALSHFIFKPKNRCLEVFALAFGSFFEEAVAEEFEFDEMEEKLGKFVFPSYISMPY